MATPRTLKPRILLIEDDPSRIERFRAWLKDTGFVLVEATSAGRALGILQPGRTAGIAGVCLDHDLEKQPVTQVDMHLSGTDVVVAIRRSIPRAVPILIHSMNATKPALMEKQLVSDGYSCTRIRMAALTAGDFGEWLDEVRDSVPEVTESAD